jgi:hypothetical protein
VLRPLAKTGENRQPDSSKRQSGSWYDMADTIRALREQMEAAAQALDFEQARRLRDQINLMRGGATATQAEQADASGLTRQKPGAMGLGTSQQSVAPPPGWKPPAKPDPLTRRRGTRQR